MDGDSNTRSTCLASKPAEQQPAFRRAGAIPAARLDLLRLPLLGGFLKWRRSRLLLQSLLGLVSAVMIAHAFWGPGLAPKNLATLLTWVHFRGLVVLAILLGGNFFCMACPFLLPRDLIRRRWSPRWEWPPWLRNKWPSIVLLVAVLFFYELFDLWADPWWTGVLIVGYFAAATLVDSLFRRASFCKYVCPVGQFNFLSSTLAPLEITVRDQETCASCRTKDCIRGRPGPAPAPDGGRDRGALPILQRGCELALFQPRKVGNIDCTFCLDCVYACPHDNVGLLVRVPGDELTLTGPRSGLRRIENRLDFGILATVFTFAALLNAFAMISPVYALEQWVARRLGLHVEWPILAGLFAAALVIEPALLLGAAAAATRRGIGSQKSLTAIATRFARSLVPIGFGVWLAHYGFHFLTGFLTVVPVTQNAVLHATGTPLLGEPLWRLGGLPATMVWPIELGFLSLGLVGSWLVAWSVAHEVTSTRVWSAWLPFAVLHGLLFAVAAWIMAQPMDMRGTFLGG